MSRAAVYQVYSESLKVVGERGEGALEAGAAVVEAVEADAVVAHVAATAEDVEV